MGRGDGKIETETAAALGLTILAGLSTGVGSAIAFFFRRPTMSFLSFALGLSAGVMIYVSFVELLPSAVREVGDVRAVVSFFLGISTIAVIDLAIPRDRNPHEYAAEEDLLTLRTRPLGAAPVDGPLAHGRTPALVRAGTLTAAAIAIHNVPEGLATFATALSDPRLGVAIALAIAIHNVPEGISVSVPIFYATGDRRRAFRLSFLSGLAEPAGAVLGYLILLPFLSAGLIASLLAFCAGIMVYISLDELLPLAHRYGKEHTVLLGILLGMCLMAASLILLARA